ncbi:adenosine deaminase [Rubricella aquisinus]|uniref:Adenosine deaminase n=1 Tax=Rubricella aquisinus TaxID=2028108 RepID=A0A840X316_9RHOB|nr:adenosine deaminase [Rubricella aquisinus]MBB5515067.1 adenosine deaminase [Rubricella aquisinus]
MNWQTLPKTELHLHLEGAAPPAFIQELAVEQGVELNGVFDAFGKYQWTDFAEFLDCYTRACTVLNSPDAFRRLAEAVLRQSAEHGVIYTEIFISPDFCGGGDPVAWQEYLAALDEGADAVPEVECRWIATAIRHLGPAKAIRDARITADSVGGRLTGFGMGGEERYLTAADFAPAFAIAGEAGLGLTSHAGEVVGPESVRDTLDHLGVTRIGHGVRSIEDTDLVSRLVAEGITLEVNPGSNIALSVYDDWADHSVARLRDAGVKVTLSTDDPPYFHTTMTHEYEMMNRVFGWTRADFDAANRLAMEAAFCDDATRTRLMTQFTETAP